MVGSESKLIENRLARPDIHQQWEAAYRTVENEKFSELAFDYITQILNAPRQSVFLDAGCGICAHAIRLANREFLVQAVDFSASVLEIAGANVRASGLETKIKIQREDILALSFGDEVFDYVLCWGVLMHIPDVEKALSELARVLRPGGCLVISEGNMFSLQAIVQRNLKQLGGRGKTIVKKTPAGIEHWKTDSAGTLLTRQANIQWLIARLRRHHFIVRKHMAGQFTEAYTKVSSRLLRQFIHSVNTFWFRYIKIPQLAYGNIIILQKERGAALSRS